MTVTHAETTKRGRHLHRMAHCRHISERGVVRDFFICGCCGAWRDILPGQPTEPVPFCTACGGHGHEADVAGVAARVHRLRGELKAAESELDGLLSSAVGRVR